GYSRPGYVAGIAWRAISWTNWTRRAFKKGAFPTKKASGRSRAIVANAASISRLVLARMTWICNPMARADISTSLNVGSVLAASAGLVLYDLQVAPRARST